MAEETENYPSLELARNAAIKWLEDRGVEFGPNRSITIGKFGDLQGMETGVQSTVGTYWRLRLDFDPQKMAHFNAEFDKGAKGAKKAFLFPGGAELIAKLAKNLKPR